MTATQGSTLKVDCSVLANTAAEQAVPLCCMPHGRDALYAESVLAPVLQELKDILSINMHFIGFKQVTSLDHLRFPALSSRAWGSDKCLLQIRGFWEAIAVNNYMHMLRKGPG
jgi:hypothetical protein